MNWRIPVMAIVLQPRKTGIEPKQCNGTELSSNQ